MVKVKDLKAVSFCVNKIPLIALSITQLAITGVLVVFAFLSFSTSDISLEHNVMWLMVTMFYGAFTLGNSYLIINLLVFIRFDKDGIKEYSCFSRIFKEYYSVKWRDIRDIKIEMIHIYHSGATPCVVMYTDEKPRMPLSYFKQDDLPYYIAMRNLSKNRRHDLVRFIERYSPQIKKSRRDLIYKIK